MLRNNTNKKYTKNLKIIHANEKINSAVVSINYPLKTFDQGLNSAINDTVTECLRLVLNKKKNLMPMKS
jgi:hypothetical protein